MSIQFDQAKLHNSFLKEEHHQWQRHLRKFIDTEIAPSAGEWDEQGRIPGGLWRKAAQFGLLGLGYPEKYGGTLEGVDIWHKNIVNEEFGRLGVGGVAASLMVHGIGLPPVLNFGSDAIKQTIAPAVLSGDKRISLAITEPGAGSDVAQISTKAVRDGDDFVINGCKTYITGGMHANWFTTAVRTGDSGAGGVSVIVIPAESKGISRTALSKKQGWWCSDTATIHFDGVRVPSAHLLGQEHQGFKVIMHNFNAERMAMATGMEGAARACLEEAAVWAAERKTFGKRLADHQVIRHKLAEMQQRLYACQGYIQTVSRQIELGHEDATAIALLKVQCSQTMEYCAREAMQILGGAGYIRGHKVERIYREVRVNAIGGGSEEIMRDLAARQMGL